MATKKCGECGLNIRYEWVRTAIGIKGVVVVMCPRCDTRQCGHCKARVPDRTADKCPKCRKSLSLAKKS